MELLKAVLFGIVEGVSDQWSLKTVWGVGYKFEVL